MSVLITKCYLLSMLVVKSNMIIEKMEMMKMMDMNDAHRLRPPSPLLDVLSHFVASRRTWQAPAQTNILFVFGVFVLLYINFVLAKWAMYQTAAQTNILAGQNR